MAAPVCVLVEFGYSVLLQVSCPGVYKTSWRKVRPPLYLSSYRQGSCSILRAKRQWITLLSAPWDKRGGAELLFAGIKNHHVSLPNQSKPWTIRQLLVWIKQNLLKDRPELFIQGETVRPGILVLINDSDWELMPSVALFACYWHQIRLCQGEVRESKLDIVQCNVNNLQKNKIHPRLVPENK